MTQEDWNFAVVGCATTDSMVPRYLGFVETLGEAAKLRRNMEIIGWKRVAVFDADLVLAEAPD